MLLGLQRHLERQPLRVDRLALELLEAAQQAFRIQAGKQRKHLRRGKPPRRRKTAPAGEQAIFAESRREAPGATRVRRVGRKQEWLRGHLPGKLAEQQLPIPQRFPDEGELQTLAVAQPAVDQPPSIGS